MSTVRSAYDLEHNLETTSPASIPAGPRGLGWIVFAGIMLGIGGVYNVLDGILAISSSKVFSTTAIYVWNSNLHTWGWILLILGVLEVCAAFALFVGSEVARWFGIVAASMNAMAQLLFLHGYPLWSVAMFSVDILIVFALAVYGGAQLRRGSTAT